MNTEKNPEGVYEAAIRNLLHGESPPIVKEQAKAVVARLLRAADGAVGDVRQQAFRDAADIIANEFLADRPNYTAPVDLAEKLLSPVEYWADMANSDAEAEDMDCRYDGPFATLADLHQEYEGFPASEAKACRLAIASEYAAQLGDDFEDRLREGLAEAVDDLLATLSVGNLGPFWAEWEKPLIQLKPSFTAAFLRLLDRHAELSIRRILTEEEASRHTHLRRRLEVDASGPGPHPVMRKSDVLSGATDPGEDIPLRAIRAMQWLWCDELSSLNDGSMSDMARFSAFHATLLAWVLGFGAAGGDAANEWCAHATVMGRIFAVPPQRDRPLFFTRDSAGLLVGPFDDHQSAAESDGGPVFAGRRVRLSEALERAGFTQAGEAKPRTELSTRGSIEDWAAKGCRALEAEVCSSTVETWLDQAGLPNVDPRSLDDAMRGETLTGHMIGLSTRYPKLGLIGSAVARLDSIVELGAFVVDKEPYDPECAKCADFPSEFKGLGDDNA